MLQMAVKRQQQQSASPSTPLLVGATGSVCAGCGAIRRGQGLPFPPAVSTEPPHGRVEAQDTIHALPGKEVSRGLYAPGVR